ncbi:MAG: type IV toxin-antitoxin system AbiEi family antitoxin domain-containing protein [Ramlibacter sp.]
MGSTGEDFSFKALLATLPRGEPLDVSFLKEKGLSPAHASHLAKAGWLDHLGRGAYMLPGDTLTRDGCLALLMRRYPGLHVGGKTALDWRGTRHNISFRQSVNLWGEGQVQVPAWLSERVPCTYQCTRLFDRPHDSTIKALPNGHPDVMVSVPERALLEMLSDVGKLVTLEDARSITESLHSLRTSVLENLLESTRRIKVVRLARTLAEELNLPWTTLARKISEKKGGGARWIAVSKSGERLALKR